MNLLLLSIRGLCSFMYCELISLLLWFYYGIINITLAT